MRRLCAACAAFATSATYAHAGGLVIGGGSPRAVGRAGTGTVGDDGVGALLVNPAAIARRDGKRGQLGLAISDDEISWQGASDAPSARNQSPSNFVPTGAVIGSIGSWVIGLGAMTSSVASRRMRPPSDLPPSELANAFEFRYAGIAGSYQRDTITLGVARRLGDSVAVGLAVGASRVTLSESRRVWAGFGGRDVIGDPELDVEIAFAGTDWFVPSVVAGVLVAPAEAEGRIELGASIGWTQTVGIAADAGARTADTAKAPRIAANGPSASLRIRQPLAVRAGARYLGDRFVAEVGGDVWVAPVAAAETTWSVSGVTVIDRTGVTARLGRVPSRVSMRTHGAIRGSLDLELIGGFLWATTGYAYQVAAVAETRQTPSFGDLGGQTFALGLEGTAGGFTFTLGWSRTWATQRRTDTTLGLDNPFGAGTKAVPVGSYDGSIDQIGVLVDAELDP